MKCCDDKYLCHALIIACLIWLVVVGVAEEDGVHVLAGKLVQLVVPRKDQQSYLAAAQHGQLVGLLQESDFSLRKGYL